MSKQQFFILEEYIKNPDKYVFPFVIKEKQKSRTIITYNKGKDYGEKLRREHDLLLEQFRMNFAQRNIHSFAYHKNVRCLDAVEDHLQSHHFIKLDIHHFFELFVAELADRYKLNIHRVKTVFDLTLLAVSVSLALILFGDIGSFDWRSVGYSSFHSIGLGTLVTTAINSPLISLMSRLIKRIFEPSARFSKLEQLLKR